MVNSPLVSIAGKRVQKAYEQGGTLQSHPKGRPIKEVALYDKRGELIQDLLVFYPGSTAYDVYIKILVGSILDYICVICVKYFYFLDLQL